MAHEDDPLEHERASWKPSPGLAVAVTDPGAATRSFRRTASG